MRVPSRRLGLGAKGQFLRAFNFNQSNIFKYFKF